SQRSIGSLQSPDVGTGYSPPSISAFLDERKRNHEKRAKWAKFTFQAASRDLEWHPCMTTVLASRPLVSLPNLITITYTGRGGRDSSTRRVGRRSRSPAL